MVLENQKEHMPLPTSFLLTSSHMLSQEKGALTSVLSDHTGDKLCCWSKFRPSD